MFKKKLLWVILLFSFVCGAENEMSFSQQAKPLILAKNDKNLSKKRKNKTYKRKKRAKSSSLRKRRVTRKKLLLSVSEYRRLSGFSRQRYIQKIRRAYLWFELQAGYNKLQGLSRKRKKSALLLLPPLLIPYSEAASSSGKCLIGGVLRSKTASGECPIDGRACDGSKSFKCGGIFSGACVPIHPVNKLSKRCYDKSKNQNMTNAQYQEFNNQFSKEIKQYCKQKSQSKNCKLLSKKLEQIKKNIKEKSGNDTAGTSSISSKTDSAETDKEDTKTEATDCPDCGGGTDRASDQANQFASLQEAGEALKKASATNNPDFLPVCERTKQVKKAIERLLKKSCEDITKDDLLKITSLDLSKKRIKSLKSGDFSGLVNLKELNLGYNYINKLPPELFYDLKELTKLNLYCVSYGCYANKESLHSLDKDQFKYNTKLTELDIGGNRLTSLDKDLFTHNTNLTDLGLGDNGLKSLDKDQFKYNTKLTELDIGKNRLTSLDKDQFKTNIELTELSLGRNRLGSLDKDQFRYNTKLTELDIGGNALGINSSLDKDQFRYNTKLTKLNLRANYLKNLDKDQFKHNTKLTELNISSNNDLRSLDKDQFKTNTELTNLNLNGTGGYYGLSLHKDFFKHNTKLTELNFHVFSGYLHPDPDLLKHNTQLKYLDIEFSSGHSGRKITIPENFLANATKLEKVIFNRDRSFVNDDDYFTLPENLFEKNTHLKKVYIEQVANIPENLLVNAEKLETFRLKSHNINQIPEKLFEKNTNLKKAYIQSDALTSVPTKTLANAPSLQEATINSKGITNLSGDDFEGSEQLTSVHVSADNLSKVDENVLVPVPELRSFSLESSNLPSLPDNLLEKSSELRNLYLHVDNVESFSKDFIASNEKLEGLSLKAAKVETYPEGFFRNTHEVRGMTFEDNKSFKAFHPDAFKSMTRLRELEMINNPQMQSLPDLTHTNLGTIKVAGNDSLSHVPGGWLNKGINQVEFFGNQGVRSFSKDAFKGLTEMREISIKGHSLLNDIPPGIFSGLSGLQYVTFSDNPLLTGEKKTRIIEELKTEYPDLILFWDGLVQRW